MGLKTLFFFLFLFLSLLDRGVESLSENVRRGRFYEDEQTGTTRSHKENGTRNAVTELQGRGMKKVPFEKQGPREEGKKD